MAVTRVATPELDKLAAVREKSQLIGDFLEWLQGEGLVICEWHDKQYVNGKLVQPAGYYPVQRRMDQLLADYFGINLKAVERERQAVLNAIRRDAEAGREGAGHAEEGGQ